MSLTNPYRQKNYMGEYAAETGGGSVLEFIQANKWDTNADGTGDPRPGMSFFNTTSASLKTYSGTAWTAPGSPTSSFDQSIWVDADNGDDGGDGSKGAPYATLAAAAAGVAAPSDFAEFSTKITFHVGPGTYSAAVTLPHRLYMTIIGYNAVISGDITWNYDIQYYGVETPGDHFHALIFDTPAFGGLTISGDLTCKNEVTDGTGLANRYLYINRSYVLGSIVNLKAGNIQLTDGTGSLRLSLAHCEGNATASTKYIGGEREETLEGNIPNYVILSAWSSSIYQQIAGCVQCSAIDNAEFYGDIDYTKNPADGGSGYSGELGGNAQGRAFTNTRFQSGATLRFGWDGFVEEQPEDVYFDAISYASALAATLTFSGGTSFVLLDQAKAVAVDNSGWTGRLDSEATVQEALDAFDALPVDPAPIDNAGFGGNISDDKTTLQAVLDEFDRPAAESIWPGAFVNSSAKIDSVRGQAQDIFSFSVYGDTGTLSNTYLTPENSGEGIPVPLNALISITGRIEAIRSPVVYSSPYIKVWDIDLTVYNDKGHVLLVDSSTNVVSQIGPAKTNEWYLSVRVEDETQSFFIRGYKDGYVEGERVYFQGSLRATMLVTTNMYDPGPIQEA